MDPEIIDPTNSESDRIQVHKIASWQKRSRVYTRSKEIYILPNKRSVKINRDPERTFTKIFLLAKVFKLERGQVRSRSVTLSCTRIRNKNNGSEQVNTYGY